MAGRLSGTADGCPVEIVADGTQVDLLLPGLRGAWKLRGRSIGVTTLLNALHHFGFDVTLAVGTLRLAVVPRPHPVVRLFGPKFDAI